MIEGGNSCDGGGDAKPLECCLCGKPSTHICDCSQCRDMLEMDGDDDPVMEPKIHGVFAVRDYAENKATRLRMKTPGYVAVLKQRLRGAI